MQEASHLHQRYRQQAVLVQMREQVSSQATVIGLQFRGDLAHDKGGQIFDRLRKIIFGQVLSAGAARTRGVKILPR